MVSVNDAYNGIASFYNRIAILLNIRRSEEPLVAETSGFFIIMYDQMLLLQNL